MSEKKEIIHFTGDFPSSLQARRDVLDELLKRVLSYHESVSLTADEITLVIDEAITNAMEHGNQWDESKQVHVKLAQQNGSLLISIEDEGNGFDFKNPQSEFVNGNKLSQRGRGISLIKKFCEPRWENGGRLIVLPLKTIRK
jgi:anti-sigma regulatory factor (Ser/Thr protein kinase)